MHRFHYTLVTTSNRAPDELYKNGLNRAQFVPCIEAIKARCVLHPMESERDYRLTGTIAGSAEREKGGGGCGGGVISGGSTSKQTCASRGRGSSETTWKVTSDVVAAEEWLSKRLKRLTKEEKMVTVAGRRCCRSITDF